MMQVINTAPPGNDSDIKTLKYAVNFKYLIYIALCYSCGNINSSVINKKPFKDSKINKIELIRENALCQCIYEGFKKNNLQEWDNSTWGNAELCECDPRIFIKTDSLARKFARYIRPMDPVNTPNDDTLKKPIIASCMDFYRSKQLDSLIRSELKKQQ
jgi:hypothetical protein